MLDRYGMVERRGRLRRRAEGAACLSVVIPTNCGALTTKASFSRFLLACEAPVSTQQDYAFIVFERLLQKRGPAANIRTVKAFPSLRLIPCST